MNSDENFFRPAFELLNALTLFCTGVLLISVPWMLPKTIAYPVALASMLLGITELYKGLKVKRFHRNLKEPKPSIISPARIPRSTKALWLGIGFRWTAVHSQRLYDVKNKTDALKNSSVYEWVRRNEDLAAYTNEAGYLEESLRPCRRYIANITTKRTWWNPFAPIVDLGGYAPIHGIEVNENDVLQPIDERTGHTAVLGTTRVGKTRLAEILIAQDIARKIPFTNEFEAAVAIFDPKGDGELFARAQAEALRNGRKFYAFHLGFPDISARYNGVSDFNRVSECATRTAGQLDGSGDGAAFKEFVWRFVNIISLALFSMGEIVSFKKINLYIQDMEKLFIELAKYVLSRYENTVPELKEWQSEVNILVQQYKKPNDRALEAMSKEGLALYRYLESNSRIIDEIDNKSLVENLRSLKHCVTHYDATYFSKITASLLPLLEKLTSGRTAELIAPDYDDLADNRPIFSWRQILREKAVIYIGLDAMQDTAVASAVGNTMFADLLSTSGEIYKHGDSHGLYASDPDKKPAIYVHADEFNELVGDEFLPLCNKAGGSGVKLTCYSQSRFDLDAKVGKDKAEVMLSNFNTLIMMRVKTKSTAQYLTDQLPEVSVSEILEVSGATTKEISSFDVKNEDRKSKTSKPMLTESDIINQPKGSAFVLHGGSRLDKVRFPLIADNDPEYQALRQSDLVKEMERRYKAHDPGEVWKKPDNFDWKAGYLNGIPTFEKEAA